MADFNSNNDANKLNKEFGKDRGQRSDVNADIARGDSDRATNRAKELGGDNEQRTLTAEERAMEARRIAGLREAEAKDGNEASVGDESVHRRGVAES